jgi:hypothetical protein
VAVTPRFEFRVFGEDIAGAWETLGRDGTPEGEPEERTDSYFVVPGHVDASLKLRADRLDLKLMLREEAGLELWRPAGTAEFPVGAAALRTGFLRPAGLRLDPGRGPVGRDELLACAWAATGTRVVEVRKRRQKYRFAGALAERTGLTIGGAAIHSIAIQTPDRAAAAGAVAALGLADRRNVSYQRFLVEASFAG